MEKLKEYNKKRNFKKTSEPTGKSGKVKKSKKLIFVVQHHIARKDHYDFRLEWKGVLLSWAVPKGLSWSSKDKRLAIQVEDHPLDYATFEGTIPKGEYGGGTVMLWDEGYWEPNGDVDEGLKEGTLKFMLHGKRLVGNWTLIKLKNDKENEQDNWLIVKEKDEYEDESISVDEFNTSIKTGRTMEEITENKSVEITKNPFKNASVQLVKMVDRVPEGDEWIYEMKFDGYRIISYIENNSAELLSRNNTNYTEKFSTITESLIKLANGRSAVVDGEVVIADESGVTNFQLLQNYLKNKKVYEPVYVLFDILALDGEDLRKLPLVKRKQILKEFLKGAPKNITYSKDIKGRGQEIFEQACKLKTEGIVAKKKDSVYSGTRSLDWVKVKCNNRQEFVIGGYTVTSKKTKGFSALLVGYYEEGELIFAGRVGTGYTEKMREDIEKELKKIVRKTCPFNVEPSKAKDEKMVFVRPSISCEVQFAEFTNDNLLRQASFKGLRYDKDIKEIVKEKKESIKKTTAKTTSKTTSKKNKDEKFVIANVEISSPDKIIYKNSQVKKIDVIKYYEKVASRMLPYIHNRLISIKRCPNGTTSECFFERKYNYEAEGIKSFPIKNSENKTSHYFYVENLQGLIYQAQLNTIEFHIWANTVNDFEHPNIMTFDLDPDKGMDLKQVRQGVKDLKSVLDKLGLKSFVKTSGGKGYHVVVPFKPTSSWEKFSNFAQSVAKLMEQNWPDKYTSNIRMKSRKGKIFIDWIRNSKSATSIAPYSLRVKDKPTVSMPISWRELGKVTPDGISMDEAIKRLKRVDPWKDFFNVEQELE